MDQTGKKKTRKRLRLVTFHEMGNIKNKPVLRYRGLREWRRKQGGMLLIGLRAGEMGQQTGWSPR